MELWIRSQDKESLTKVNNVQYTYRKGDLYSNVRGNHYIGTYYDNLKILGEYATKERALEVLDEIQNILMPKYIINNKSIKMGKPYKENEMILMDCCADARLEQINTYKVYEMPSE